MSLASDCVNTTSLMAATESTAQAGALNRPDGTPIRVLVVDDEPNLTESCQVCCGTRGESLRILPDLVKLPKNLSTDPALPARVRVRVGLLMVYLALPLDLIPDFIPVLGYADDAIVAVAVLRSVVRAVGLESLRGHWSGTPDGFTSLCRLAGLQPQTA